jgi:hypothetical protein
MLTKGIKVSAGTDATRVASYNPWVALSWMVTGKTVAGLRIYPQHNCLDRETALRMYTENVTWFSNEEGKKGRIAVGQFADLIVPDRDYFSCAEAEIADTISDLTIVGGRVVYGAGDFATLDDGKLPEQCPTGRRCAPMAAMQLGVPAGHMQRRSAKRWHPAAAPTSAASMTTTMPAHGLTASRSRTSNHFGASSAAIAGLFKGGPHASRVEFLWDYAHARGNHLKGSPDLLS